MRAIILSGGKGTRLRPFTTLIPKPLVPIGGKYSILEIIIMQLAKQGFDHVTLAVNHLSHLIMSYFGNGERWGIKLDYSMENSELSTIGPLTLIENLPSNFLVMNGDILSDISYVDFLSEHIRAKSEITVASFSRQVKIDFGVLETNEDSILTKFIEKPTYDYKVSMGVYGISRKVIENLERGSKYGFDNLMLDGLREKNSIKIVDHKGYWLDIGRGEDYDLANENSDEIMKKLNIDNE